MGRRLLFLVLALLGFMAGPAQAALPREANRTDVAQQTFSWANAYAQAQPGQTITVPAGTYANVTLAPRSDLVGRCSVSNPAGMITFDVPNPVTATGEFEIRGSCVHITGRSGPYGANATFNVQGRIMAITDVSGQHPDNVLVEHARTNTVAVHGGESIVYRDIDVGPATTTSNSPQGGCFIKESPGAGDENKVASRAGFVPRNVLWERLRIHDQNADRNREIADCHFGGMFIVNADGFTLRSSIIGGGNVVYNVQIQNFAGPAPRNLFFLNNAFACPSEWAYISRSCNGQQAIQLNTSDQNVSNIVVSGNNWSARELYGCAVPGCRFSAFSASGNTQFPFSYDPPPVPGDTPPPSPACSNGADDDGDGKIDFGNDPGCSSATDNDETDAPPPPPVDQPPVFTGGLRIVTHTRTTATFGWNRATDDKGIVSYRLYRDGTFLATAGPNALKAKFSTPCGAHVFRVEAVDTIGQRTPQSITFTRAC